MPTRKFVIDTSLFVNPHARKMLGRSPRTAVKGFIRQIKNKDVELYMPPSVFNELKNFVGNSADELESYVKKRPPNLYAIYLPAAVLYYFVEDVRLRINKGLKLAEFFAQDNKPNNAQKIKKLRDKYRDAMRTGLLDSKEDFDLLLLAKELEATLVSSDEGVIKFANQIGCEWIRADKLHTLLKTIKKS